MEILLVLLAWITTLNGAYFSSLLGGTGWSGNSVWLFHKATAGSFLHSWFSSWSNNLYNHHLIPFTEPHSSLLDISNKGLFFFFHVFHFSFLKANNLSTPLQNAMLTYPPTAQQTWEPQQSAALQHSAGTLHATTTQLGSFLRKIEEDQKKKKCSRSQ